MRRLSWPSGSGGLGGLTRSDEGGLEEVEESFRTAASCAWSRWQAVSRASKRAWRASSCACNRWQLGHGAWASASMPADSTACATDALSPCAASPVTTPVNRYGSSFWTSAPCRYQDVRRWTAKVG